MRVSERAELCGSRAVLCDTFAELEDCAGSSAGCGLLFQHKASRTWWTVLAEGEVEQAEDLAGFMFIDIERGWSDIDRARPLGQAPIDPGVTIAAPPKIHRGQPANPYAQVWASFQAQGLRLSLLRIPRAPTI